MKFLGNGDTLVVMPLLVSYLTSSLSVLSRPCALAQDHCSLNVVFSWLGVPTPDAPSAWHSSPPPSGLPGIRSPFRFARACLPWEMSLFPAPLFQSRGKNTSFCSLYGGRRLLSSPSVPWKAYLFKWLLPLSTR